nr:hypothetical protein [uncultured Rhodopila sp.]
MEELDIIGATFGNDKSSSRHDYLRHYDGLFARHRRERFNFIEIGVFNSASLATWRSYFENAAIVGVDIQDQPGSHAEDGIIVEVGSRDDPGFLYDLARRYPPRIISDDGSHRSQHVLFTFETLFPALEPGGYYLIEGLRSLQPATRDVRRAGQAQVDPIDYFFDLSRTVMTGQLDPALDWGFRGYARNWIDEVLVHRQCCVIRKKPAAVGGSVQLDAVEKLAATIGSADAWERAALFINANGGSVERTIAALNSAIAIKPSSRLFRYLSEMHAAAGRMDEAVKIARRAAYIDVDENERTESLEHYGNMLIATGQINKGVEVFTAALEGVTHPVIRHRILSNIAEHQGRV